MFVREL